MWLATGTVLASCLIVGRLLFAPVDLGFARSELIERTEAFLPGWRIDFSETEIGWNWRSVRPWISISDLTLIDRADRLTARIPEMNVGVSFTSILGGISFSTIQIDEAQVLVSDLAGFSDATGGTTFSDLFGEGGVPKPEVFRPISDAFGRFSRRLMREAPALDSIVIRSGRVGIVRGEGFPNALFTFPRFDLTRHDNALQMESLLDVSLGPLPTQVRLSGQARPDVGELSVQLAFSQLRPVDLAGQADLPDFIDDLAVPLGLELELNMRADTGLIGANFSLSMDEGVLFDEVRFPEPAPIKYGLVEGIYDPADNLIVIDTIELQVGDRLVSGDGAVYWLQGYTKPGTRLSLYTADVTVDEIKRYWPIKTYPDGRHRGARAWVDQHMHMGNARNVRFDVNWSPESGGAFDNGSAYRMTFDFEGVDTRYLGNMPPIKEAKGRGILTREEMDIYISSGTLVGMPIDGSEGHLKDIHIKEDTMGTFDIRLEGEVPVLLDLLSYEPLRVPQKAKIDIGRLDGDAKVRALVVAPLQKGVPADQIRYDVYTRIGGAVVRDLLGGEGIQHGDLILVTDNDKLSVEGAAELNGVPMDIYWRENIKAGRESPDADTTEIVMSGMLDDQDIAALGVNLAGYLVGETMAEATFIGRNLDFHTGFFSADATNSILRDTNMAYIKPVGVPASITGTVYLKEDRFRVAPLLITGEEIDLTLQMEWDKNNANVMDVDITARQLGKHRLAGTVSIPAKGPANIHIVAEQFDLGAFIAELEADTSGTIPQSDDPVPENKRTLIELDADRMLLLNGESVGNVKLNAELLGDVPQSLSFDGVVYGTEKTISLTIDETGDPVGNRLEIESENAGHLLRGLGIFSHIRDGALELEGFTSGWGESLRISGEARIDNSFMVPGDDLDPAVTEGVVSGLNDFLSGNPAELSKIEVPFSYDTGLLDLSGLQANGPRLGVTMEGQISPREDKINVNGVYVPAYGLNSLLGKIPLVGNLLTGGEGKGVFGVAFRVKGDLENPDFTINPLSGIAPGFLRLLFEGRKGKVADVNTPQEDKAAEANESDPPKSTPSDEDKPEKTDAGVADEEGPDAELPDDGVPGEPEERPELH